jgi:ribosomal protein L37E
MTPLRMPIAVRRGGVSSMRQGSIHGHGRCSRCGRVVQDVKTRRCPQCGGERITWAFAVDVVPSGAKRELAPAVARRGGCLTPASTWLRIQTHCPVSRSETMGRGSRASSHRDRLGRHTCRNHIFLEHGCRRASTPCRGTHETRTVDVAARSAPGEKPGEHLPGPVQLSMCGCWLCGCCCATRPRYGRRLLEAVGFDRIAGAGGSRPDPEAIADPSRRSSWRPSDDGGRTTADSSVVSRTAPA